MGIKKVYVLFNSFNLIWDTNINNTIHSHITTFVARILTDSSFHLMNILFVKVILMKLGLFNFFRRQV